MNGWKILEVVMGITFVYLLLSLLASAALEWLAGSLLHKGTGVIKSGVLKLSTAGWKAAGSLLGNSMEKGDPWSRRLGGLHRSAAKFGSKLMGPLALPPRHEVLEKALQQLLGPAICKEFYAHPLLRGFAGDDKKPSYISSKTFRLILLDLAMREYRKDAGPEAERAFVMQHLERMVSASAQLDAASQAGETVPAELVEPKEK